MMNVPDCTSKNFHSSGNKLSPTSKPFNEQINPPFENLSTSDDSCLSPVSIHSPVVDIKLSNDITLLDVKNPATLTTTKLVSPDSSLSGKSQIYKMFAEQKRLLVSQKQLPSKSTFLGEDSMSDANLLPSQKNSIDIKYSVCDTSSDSSLPEKSPIYKFLAEQRCLLTSQKQLSSKATISGENSLNYDEFPAKKISNDVKESVSDKSSGSSSSGKYLSHKMFADQKHLLISQKQFAGRLVMPSNEPIGDAGLLSVEVNSNDVKNSLCDTFLSQAASTSSTSLCDKLKKLLENSKLAKSQCSSDTSCDTPQGHNSSCADGELDSCKSSFSSMNRYSDFLNQGNSSGNKFWNEQCLRNSVSSDADDVNLCHLKKDNLSTNALVQNEDPWTRLRDAFAELGPTKYSSRNVKFIPAGMQY